MYNKELRKSKRDTWREHCSKISNLPDLFRLQKSLKKEHSNGLSTLRKPDGSYTETSMETGKLLLETHFPECIAISPSPILLDNRTNTADGTSKKLVDKIISTQTVQWAINKFEPYKAPGPDGVYPCLLQQGSEVITKPLVRIFKASLLINHIPSNWTEVNVIFIPKAGRANEQSPKSVRPISLSPFPLKIMEKLIDYHIRMHCLKEKPLNKQQFAYQPGKSTETAIHCLTSKIEKTLKAKQISLCGFIDITGAFDNTTYEAIETSMVQKNIPPLIINWTLQMLKGRIISTTIGDEKLSISATRGCPQGGVLSPLLWTLVIDDLLNLLKQNGFDAQGYADDLVITVTGSFEDTISERIQEALKMVTNWCTQKGLSTNPDKTTLVPFTNRNKINLKPPTVNGKTFEFSDEAKYLGVILDKRLSWNQHLEYTIEKATKAFYSCQRLHGKIWGISPRMTYWSFTTIIKPIITYASLAWWPKTKQRKAEAKLGKLHRLVCGSITGAMKSCPTDALAVLTGIPPLPILIEKEACQGALRLQEIAQFKSGDLQGHLSVLNLIYDDPYIKIPDRIPQITNFNKKYKINIPKRENWEDNFKNIKNGAQIWYTDGSKLENGNTGAGIMGPWFQKAIPMGTTPTIFQAELFAIETCVRECLKRKTNGATIHIMSDSQAVLMALNATEIRSGLVDNCIKLLNDLGNKNTLTVEWIPGHEGYEGNERADCLAKRGAQRQFIGPEPFCALPKVHIKERLNLWEQKSFQNHWMNSNGQRQAKKFIIPSKKSSNKLLELGRNDIRILTGYFTGHCKLRYHLNKMGLSDTSLCRFCEMENETPEHILCECPKLGKRRQFHFGDHTIAPYRFWDCINPSKVLAYIKSLKMEG